MPKLKGGRAGKKEKARAKAESKQLRKEAKKAAKKEKQKQKDKTKKQKGKKSNALEVLPRCVLRHILRILKFGVDNFVK
jgi:hypothetical protein